MDAFFDEIYQTHFSGQTNEPSVFQRKDHFSDNTFFRIYYEDKYGKIGEGFMRIMAHDWTSFEAVDKVYKEWIALKEVKRYLIHVMDWWELTEKEKQSYRDCMTYIEKNCKDLIEQAPAELRLQKSLWREIPDEVDDLIEYKIKKGIEEHMRQRLAFEHGINSV